MRRNLGMAILGAVILSGCTTAGSVLNPYSDKFQCPKTKNGKCVSVEEAYRESISGTAVSAGSVEETVLVCPEGIVMGESDPTLVENSCVEVKRPTATTAGKPAGQATNSEDIYEEALYREMTDLIQEPETPVVTPPKIIRVMMLPRASNGEMLYASRYIFFMLEKPRWVLDGYR